MNIQVYKIEDLVADPTFVNYCLHLDSTDHAYWTHILNTNPDKTELIQEARELVIPLSQQVSESEFAAERERTFQQLFPVQELTSRKKVKLPMRWLAAACILIIASAVYLLNRYQDNSSTEYATITQVVPAKKYMNITLSDGTKVRLAPASTFTYPKEFKGNIRKVELNGDAYFEVSHNPQKPFTVHTSHLDVQVLGTSFNVHAFTEDLITKIALFEGKVNVSNSTISKNLMPGQQFTYTKKDQKTILNTFDLIEEKDGMEGMINFDHASYEELRLKLSRKYGIVTKSDPTIKLQFTGRIFNESIAEVLEKLTFTTAYHFRLQSDSLLTVTSK
ncbi:fec operon regulator FecR [Sphingobacterium spiritivorum]|uniref:Fec operon regulator FecR n=1 Tax=Sphingobacterium spiritivorum TaxID=258 RepID=A0A380BXH8_SPHSI|nr:FecR family protein [Sphingobacterium spiritivorum]SUJ07862.1 fec operon regulator FecR [Sphingobacterium spiritivorum]